jgi:cell division protein FtsA
VAVLDIGGGTTDLAVYEDGAIVHTASLPVGGGHVNRDLVAGLRCPVAVAEEVKIAHGHARPGDLDGEGAVRLAPFGQEAEREVSRRAVAEIVQARVEEILAMAMVEARRTGHAGLLAAGLVLTGGTANLPGIARLAEEITGLPARVGAPAGLTGLVDYLDDPAYATSVGLLRWLAEEQGPDEPTRLQLRAAPSLLGLGRRLGQIVRVFLPQ